MRRSTCFALAAAVACSATAPRTSAAPATRQYTAGAAMACRPALPAYEGAIRTRPLAMANEGTTNAFITCSNWSTPYSETNYNTLVSFHNRSNAAVSVSCTLVSGGDTGFATGYTPMTVQIPAQGARNVIWGTLASANLPGTLRYSFSLPPRVELSQILWGFVV